MHFPSVPSKLLLPLQSQPGFAGERLLQRGGTMESSATPLMSTWSWTHQGVPAFFSEVQRCNPPQTQNGSAGGQSHLGLVCGSFEGTSYSQDKSSIPRALFPTLLSTEYQDPVWNKSFRNLLPSKFAESCFLDFRIFQSL